VNGRVPTGGVALGIAVGVLVVAGLQPGAREPRPVPLPASGAGAHAPARPGLAVTAIATRVSGAAMAPAGRGTRATARQHHTVLHRATRHSPRALPRVAVHPRAQAPTAPVRAVPSRPRPRPRPVTVRPPVKPKPKPAHVPKPERAPAKPKPAHVPKPERAPAKPKPAHVPKPEPAPTTTFDDSG
jgi:hypothetical protein